MKHTCIGIWSLLAIGCGLVTGCADDSPQPANRVSGITRSQSKSLSESIDTVPNAFFYFENEKVPLVIDTTHEVLITECLEPIDIPADSIYGTFRQGLYTGYVVGKGTASHYATEEQIFAIEDILTDGSPFFPEFLAVIKDLSYKEEAKTLAAELGCELKYQLENEPSFLKFGIVRGGGRKVLDITQRLYESGLFESVDPGLIPFVEEYKSDHGASLLALTGYNDQWNLGPHNGVNAIAAWNYTKGTPDITLAILDGYFNPLERPELKDHMHPYSFNTTKGTSKHGLKSALIAAGDGAPSNGYWGVAPGVRVMQIGIIPDNTYNDDSWQKTYSEGIVKGINNAISNGADVLNCSWRYNYAAYLPTVVSALRNALVYGRSGKGCVVVMAAGNEGYIEQPAKSMAEALVVGATDQTGAVCGMSGKGPELDLVAPGMGFDPPHKLPNEWGTSWAAPHVAGTAALILSMRPDLTQKEVCQVILNHTSGQSSPVNSYGRGRVDAYKALKALNGDGIGIELPVQVQNGQLTLDQASYWFSVTGAPGGSTWTIDIPGATPDEWVGGYRMTGISSPSTITITGTVDYMHRRFTVTQSLKVIPVRPVIRSVTKSGHPTGAVEPNSFDLFVDCNNWGADITWEIRNQFGTLYTVEEPYYAHDVGFLDKPGFYKTIKAADNSQWSECTIDVTVSIPGLGYDTRTIKIYGTGENARIEVM